MSNCLSIYQEEPDCSTDEFSVVLSRVISDLKEDEMNAVLHDLRNLEVNHGYDVPIYDILSGGIWAPNGKTHQHSPRTMDILILLYGRLEEKLTKDVDVIECFGVSGRYLDLIKDLADNEGIDLKCYNVHQERRSDVNFAVSGLVWFVISIIDTILTIFTKQFFTPSDSKVLVSYPIFRPGTFKPIEDKLELHFDATFTLTTISYFLRARSVIPKKTPVIPLRCFESVIGLLKEQIFLGKLLTDVLLFGDFTESVVEEVEREVGLNIERTISSLTYRTCLLNLDALLYNMAAHSAFQNGEYQSLLITSEGTHGKSLALSAKDSNVDVYALPHSITNSKLDLSFHRTRFTEGEISKNILQDESGLQFLPTGLPKHIDLFEKKKENKKDTDITNRPDNLLIGTQPFANRYREDFFREVVTSVLKHTEMQITVKIHPGEEREYYLGLLTDLSITERQKQRVNIKEKDLYRHIHDSDVLLTINSNVAIEAVILGTPAVVYDKYAPEIRTPLYSRYGNVPSFNDKNECAEFLKCEDFRSLSMEQDSLLNGPYNVRENSLDHIADSIEMEIKSLNRGNRKGN